MVLFCDGIHEDTGTKITDNGQQTDGFSKTDTTCDCRNGSGRKENTDGKPTEPSDNPGGRDREIPARRDKVPEESQGSEGVKTDNDVPWRVP